MITVLHFHLVLRLSDGFSECLVHCLPGDVLCEEGESVLEG
jgi:hypothetical protein